MGESGVTPQASTIIERVIRELRNPWTSGRGSQRLAELGDELEFAIEVDALGTESVPVA
jgi:hypothetical protein